MNLSFFPFASSFFFNYLFTSCLSLGRIICLIYREKYSAFFFFFCFESFRNFYEIISRKFSLKAASVLSCLDFSASFNLTFFFFSFQAALRFQSIMIFLGLANENCSCHLIRNADSISFFLMKSGFSSTIGSIGNEFEYDTLHTFAFLQRQEESQMRKGNVFSRIWNVKQKIAGIT